MVQYTEKDLKNGTPVWTTNGIGVVESFNPNHIYGVKVRLSAYAFNLFKPDSSEICLDFSDKSPALKAGWPT